MLRIFHKEGCTRETVRIRKYGDCTVYDHVLAAWCNCLAG